MTSLLIINLLLILSLKVLKVKYPDTLIQYPLLLHAETIAKDQALIRYILGGLCAVSAVVLLIVMVVIPIIVFRRRKRKSKQ